MGRRDWSHENAASLEELDTEAVYDGEVTNCSVFGVFVDFGFVKDGILKVQRDQRKNFRRGMQLTGLRVVDVDLPNSKVVLEADYMPEERQRSRSERPPMRSSGRGRGGAGAQPRRQEPGEAGGRGGGASRRAASVPAERSQAKRAPRKTNWGHSGGAPLDTLHEGEVFDGVVTNVSKYGVFVDIGAQRDALMQIPSKYGRKFSVGDTVSNCILASIDPEAGRIGCFVEDPQLATDHLPPKQRAARKRNGQARQDDGGGRPPEAKAKAQPKAQPKAQAQKPQNARPAKADFQPIERLKVGSLCNGVVARRTPYAVVVNIGCDADAKLDVPKSLRTQFKKGDELYGMTIEMVDVENKKITVSLENPELNVTRQEEDEEEEEEEPPPPPPRPQQRKGPRPIAQQPAAQLEAPQRPQRPLPAVKNTASPAAENGTKAKAAPKPKEKAKAKAKSKAAPLDHPDGLPLSRFRAGSLANGVVTSIGLQGVYVNVGAVTDGLLALPKHIAKQFQVADEVRGMTVEGVDDHGERLRLALDDPELEQSEGDSGPMPAPLPPAPHPVRGSGSAAAARQGLPKPKAKEKSGAGKRANALN